MKSSQVIPTIAFALMPQSISASNIPSRSKRARGVKPLSFKTARGEPNSNKNIDVGVNPTDRELYDVETINMNELEMSMPAVVEAEVLNATLSFDYSDDYTPTAPPVPKEDDHVGMVDDQFLSIEEFPTASPVAYVEMVDDQPPYIEEPSNDDYGYIEKPPAAPASSSKSGKASKSSKLTSKAGKGSKAGVSYTDESNAGHYSSSSLNRVSSLNSYVDVSSASSTNTFDIKYVSGFVAVAAVAIHAVMLRH